MNKKQLIASAVVLMIAQSISAYGDKHRGHHGHGHQSSSFLGYEAPTLFSDLTPYGHVRARGEFLDEDSTVSNAKAATIRLRAGVKADNVLDLDNVSGVAEFNHVGAFFADEYNTGSNIAGNNSNNRMTIYDPAITRLTQAYLQYQDDDTTVKVGDQFIELDDERFIGDQNWFQTPQSFRAISGEYTGVENTKIYSAVVFQRKGFIDERTHNSSEGSWLFNVQHAFSDHAHVSPFAYLLQDMHNTYGVNVKGHYDAGDYKAGYILTYAHQTNPSIDRDYDSAVKINSQFYRVGAWYKTQGIKVFYDYQVFGAAKDGASRQFSTPYASVHNFNGYSDVFNSAILNGNLVNNEGLSDLAIGAGYHLEDLGKIYLVYHKFGSAVEGRDFGSEINLAHKTKVGQNTHLNTQISLFTNGDDWAGGNDTTRATVSLTQHF